MRAVVFDLDGTLVDSTQDICTSLVHALAEGGVVPPSVEEVRALLGPPLGVMLELLAPGADHEHLASRYRAHYWEHCTDHTMPFPGVPTVLRALREEGWRIGVATLKRSAMAYRVLDRLDLLGLVDGVQGTDGFPAKPAPDVVEHTLTGLGVPADRCSWMVGDTAADVLAGRAAGLSTAAVTTGADDGLRLKEAEPDLLAGSLGEVRAAL